MNGSQLATNSFQVLFSFKEHANILVTHSTASNISVGVWQMMCSWKRQLEARQWLEFSSLLLSVPVMLHVFFVCVCDPPAAGRVDPFCWLLVPPHLWLSGIFG